MSWGVKPVPNRRSRLMMYTKEPVLLLAEGFAFKMDENYSFARGPARTGRPDRRTGRPVSVGEKREFPQEQTGLLRSAIYYEESRDGGDGNITFRVGVNVDYSTDPSALEEYLQYIEGYTKVKASRFGLAMTGESNETHQAMMQHLRANIPPGRFRVGK